MGNNLGSEARAYRAGARKECWAKTTGLRAGLAPQGWTEVGPADLGCLEGMVQGQR